jgi:hypothetical protein
VKKSRKVRVANSNQMTFAEIINHKRLRRQQTRSGVDKAIRTSFGDQVNSASLTAKQSVRERVNLTAVLSDDNVLATKISDDSRTPLTTTECKDVTDDPIDLSSVDIRYLTHSS